MLLGDDVVVSPDLSHHESSLGRGGKRRSWKGQINLDHKSVRKDGIEGRDRKLLSWKRANDTQRKALHTLFSLCINRNWNVRGIDLTGVYALEIDDPENDYGIHRAYYYMYLNSLFSFRKEREFGT